MSKRRLSGPRAAVEDDDPAQACQVGGEFVGIIRDLGLDPPSTSLRPPWKFGLLILAGLNVPVFHYGIYRRIDRWADAAVPPIAARIGAVVSLVAWTGVILAGRLLAYT